MNTTKDRAVGASPVRRPTVTERPANRAADDTERCRTLRSDETRCPNAALPHADGEPVICQRHAARVLAFVVQKQQAARRTRRTA